MKVLFLNPVAQMGGAERSLLDLLRMLRTSSHLGLITLEEGPLVASARALGIECTVLRLPEGLISTGDAETDESQWVKTALELAFRGVRGIGALARWVKSLSCVIRTFQPDIVHSNGIKTHALSAIGCPSGPPLVWHVRDFLGARPLVARALPVLAGRVAAVFAISRAVEMDVREVLPRVPVALVYNALDLHVFRPRHIDPITLDARTALPAARAGVVRIGLVATYARWKGHRVFLEAARRSLDHTKTPMRFFIVGGAVYHAEQSQVSDTELRSLVDSLSLSDMVGFVPFTERPEAIYPALDVVAHMSTRPEPFGRTLVEALACGRALVANCAAGALEEVPTSAFMPLGKVDADHAAQAFVELAENADLRRRLGVAGRAAAETFSLAKLQTRVEELYRSIARPSAYRAEGRLPSVDFEVPRS